MQNKTKEIQKIIQDKVLGIWETAHDGSGHRYRNTKTGTLQRSVTTKLGGVLAKPHLAKWQIRMAIEWLLKDDRLERLRNEHWRDEMMSGAQLAPFDVRDEAGGVGNQAHAAIERWINQGIADDVMPEDITKFAGENCDPRAIAAMRGVQKLFKDKNIIPISSEILVGHDKFSSGTLDFLCLWDGKLCLVDWKSSNQVSQEYILQAVAYKKFFEHMTSLKIQKVKILHLSKDSDKYEIYKVGNFEQAWKAFKWICGVYDWRMDPKNKLEKDIKRISI